MHIAIKNKNNWSLFANSNFINFTTIGLRIKNGEIFMKSTTKLEIQ